MAMIITVGSWLVIYRKMSGWRGFLETVPQHIRIQLLPCDEW